MKILVVDASVFGKRLSEERNSLLKHLEFWHGGYNQVDLLARLTLDVEKILKGRLKLIRLPRFSLFALISSYIFLIFKSKKYDLVIETWRGKPLFSFIFNTRRSLVAILNNDFKKIFPGKMFSYIYKNSKFLVNSQLVKDKLIKTGLMMESVKLIPDGDPTHKNNKTNVAVTGRKNKILIICGKDSENAVSFINLIERKSLDWKFIILTERKYIQKIKKTYQNHGLTSGLKVIPLNLSVLKSNLVNSKYLLVTKYAGEISKYVLSAFLVNTPVILEEGVQLLVDKKISNLIIKFDNQMDLVSKILTLSKNDSEYKKLQNNISKVSKLPSWDEVSELSLRFIESL